MPQYRRLYTKVLESFDFDALPDDFTRLTWVLLPLVCCREGRGIDSATWLISKLYPLRTDVTPAMMETAMSNFAAAHADDGTAMIRRYSVNGRPYFQITNWKMYQSGTDRESASPYPPENFNDALKTDANADADAYSYSYSENVNLLVSNSGVTPELVVSNSGASHDPVRQLAARFRELTAITPNDSAPTYATNWHEPLTSFLKQADGDIDRAMAAMESAIETARRPGNGKRAYTVASPKSIATFYANVIAGQHARGDADHAARLWQAAIDSIAARTWTDEALRRAVTKVGGASKLKAVSEREQPELAQELYREYKRLHTAA